MAISNWKVTFSKVKGGNALRLLQFVKSDETANLWLSVVQADPSKVDSKDLSGLFVGEDGSISAAQIPAVNAQKSAAHELLGHVGTKCLCQRAGQSGESKRGADCGRPSAKC